MQITETKMKRDDLKRTGLMEAKMLRVTVVAVLVPELFPAITV